MPAVFEALYTNVVQKKSQGVDFFFYPLLPFFQAIKADPVSSSRTVMKENNEGSSIFRRE